MRIIPRSFLWRTILLIMIPLVLCQVIMANVFFGNHWDTVHTWMSRSLSGEISTIVTIMDDHPESFEKIQAIVSKDMGLNVTRSEKLYRPKHDDSNSVEIAKLATDLKKNVKYPTKLYIDQKQKLLYIDIKHGQNDYITVATSLKRVYSTSTEIFALWLFLSLVIVAAIITPFVWNHNRSIRKIARAANYFGRGLDMPNFKPSGSTEIREAANALIVMKSRMNRYTKTRTDMLNAVSHDLKTPLTRVRLAVETNKKLDEKSRETMLSDLDRMNDMIGGYLSFARGDIPELEQEITLPPMVTRLIRDYTGRVKFKTNFPDKPISFYSRPMSLSRAIDNIIQNAERFAIKKIEITETDDLEYTTLTIDDDGIGIPLDKRNDALQPFVRLDPSRNEKTGGTGLGLCIAQQAIENHGGQMFLEDSPLGGLRVRIVLPI